MSLHAERGARLERMRRLAEVGKRGKLVIRIGVLVQRENAILSGETKSRLHLWASDGDGESESCWRDPCPACQA